MITVPQAVAEIVKQSPLIEEGLSRGVLNTSGVARDIRQRVEKRTHKPVTEGAIVMSLKRLSENLARQDPTYTLFQSMPDMVIRSNLFERTLSNSPTLLAKQQRLLALADSYGNQHFLTITAGVFETTIIASDALRPQINEVIKGESQTSEIRSLSSITIRLTKDIVTIPGSYAQILKLIAWEGINIIEVVSTHLELTIILRQDEADRAFSVLKSAFSER